MASALRKSETNKSIEVFAYDSSKYCFELSCIIALFLLKGVFLCFNCILPLYETCLD